MGNRKPTNLPSKAETIAKYQTHEGDTGSPEVQIALLTDRIIHLTEHLKTNKKSLIYLLENFWLEKQIWIIVNPSF